MGATVTRAYDIAQPANPCPTLANIAESRRGAVPLASERLGSDETKYQGEQNREDDRCHDWEIDADISVGTLVFDVAGQKRKSRCDIEPIGGCASVSEPTDGGKNEQHDNEDFEKGCHDTIDVFRRPAASFVMVPGTLAIGNS